MTTITFKDFLRKRGGTWTEPETEEWVDGLLRRLPEAEHYDCKTGLCDLCFLERSLGEYRVYYKNPRNWVFNHIIDDYYETT